MTGFHDLPPGLIQSSFTLVSYIRKRNSITFIEDLSTVMFQNLTNDPVRAWIRCFNSDPFLPSISLLAQAG